MNKKLQATIEKMPQTGFHFNDEAHVYVLDGKPLTGVTTILSVIAKPALIQWAADEAVKHLGWYNEKYVEDDGLLEALALNTKWEALKTLSTREFYAKLCEARTQHAKRKKDAGTTGTDVHAVIEVLIKSAIQNNNGYIENAQYIQKNPLVHNFVQWANENKVKFLASEKRIYSKTHWYAGTVDFIAEIDGKVWIGDIKTSSAVYPEYFFQTAGYQLALQEMGDYPEIEGHVIVNCKKNGEFEVQKSYGYAQNVEAFKAALIIYRAQETLKATL